MRILYHHRTRGEDAQGIHIRELIRAFRSLGHDVTLVAPLARRQSHEPKPTTDKTTTNKAANDTDNSSTLRQWLYELALIVYNVPAFFLLGYRLLRGRHDFIYERYSLFSISGCLLAKLTRRPLFLEVNAPLSLEMRQHDGLRLTGLAQTAEDWTLARATRVIVVTSAMRQIFLDRGLPSERFLVMPNGVDREAFHPAVDATEVRRRWHLGDGLVVGFVGWIRPWHGVNYLLDAVAQCLPALPMLRLLIVGDGPAVADLKRQAQQLGVAEQVVFTGAVDSRDIPAHVAAMDIAVQPDVTEYASPIKLFEYLALGKAVIAPDKPNILEVVSDRDTALIYTPGDVAALRGCIEELAGDQALRERLAAAALALVERRGYYWEANAQKVIDEVKTLTESG